MKILLSMLVVLIALVLTGSTVFAQTSPTPNDLGDRNKSVTVTQTTTVQNLSPPEWPPCCPPVIISQAEINSPFKFLPDNSTCTSQPAVYPQYGCLTNLVPGRKVECVYFSGNSCVPIHQYVKGTNQNCTSGLTQLDILTSSTQWYDVYNTQNKTVQLQYFDDEVTDGKSMLGNKGGPNFAMSLGPHEKCTRAVSDYSFQGIPEFKPVNMTMKVSYYYDGKPYTTATPQFTDIYNDSRTWQFDGTQWIFAEQNTVPVPEFPLAIPILLASIASLLFFNRINSRK